MSEPSQDLSGIVRLLRPYGPSILLSALCGAVAAVATVGLIAGVNEALNLPAGSGSSQVAFIIALFGVAVSGRVASDVLTNRIGQRLVADIRRDLALRILAAPIDALERYRTHRVIPVLTHDVDMVSDFAFMLSSLIISLSVALACMTYLAWLSPFLFAIVFVVLVVGSAVQYAARGVGIAGFDAARSAEDRLHKGYEGMLAGAKELRLNRQRRARFFSRRIDHTIAEIRTINGRAIAIFVTSNAIGSALVFLAVALTLLWADTVTADRGVLSAFVLTLVFVKGPIDQILEAIPTISRAQVAFRRIAGLSVLFASPEALTVGSDESAAPAIEGRYANQFRSLELRGVAYSFPDTGSMPPFKIGPVDLRVNRGEIVFIVGDNGSGKTTLIKLLLGLYEPQAGAIFCNGTPVGPDDRDDYRQLFATVFSDCYLFDDVEPAADAATQDVMEHLRRFDLDHKVEVRNGMFSTTDLSTGQRKRLAMVHVLLQDRPVIVLDEWAADQHHVFRHVFYTELLPELSARGRTLIVISHDDRYFHVADRVVRMANGRIVEEKTLKGRTLLETDPVNRGRLVRTGDQPA